MLELNSKLAVSSLQSLYNEQQDLDLMTKTTPMDNLKSWVYVAPTIRCPPHATLSNDQNVYGLFAAQTFLKGDIVGGCMGRYGFQCACLAALLMIQVTMRTRE